MRQAQTAPPPAVGFCGIRNKFPGSRGADISPHMARSRKTAIYPLGRQPDGRYATETHGMVIDHDTGEKRRELTSTYRGPTQEVADKMARKAGEVWERAGDT
jgi:hypothetical protein